MKTNRTDRMTQPHSIYAAISSIYEAIFTVNRAGENHIMPRSSQMSRRSRGGLLLLAVFSILLAPAAWAGFEQDLTAANKALSRDLLDRAIPELDKLRAKHDSESKLHAIYGEVFWRQGRLSDAKREFDQALSLDKNSAFAMAGRSVVAFSLGDLKGAESFALQALDKKKSLWLANYAMGRVELNRGNLDTAYEYFEKGKRTKKRLDGRDLFDSAMGLLSLQENDPEAAETSLIQARAKASQTVEHVMNLAEMYEMTEKWGQAVTLLEGMKKKSSSAQISYRLGHAYQQQRRFNDALKQYQEAIESDENFAPAIAALGNIYLLDSRQTKRAFDFLKRAHDIDPDLKGVRRGLGIVLIRMRKGEEALPYLAIALENSPDDLYTKVAIARAHLQTDDWEKGLSMFEEDADIVLEAKSEDLTEVGVRLIRAKDFPMARRYLGLALERDPKNVEAIYRDGVLDLHEKNYAAAIDKITKKVEKQPRSASAAMNLGVAYMGKREYPNAVKWFDKTTKLAPKSKGAWVQLAGALQATNQIPKAILAYSRVLSLDPGNVSASRGRGYLYLVQGQYPQAIKDLRSVLRTEPDDAEVWVGLGQALANVGGQISQAKSAFETALKLAPDNESALEGLDAIRSALR